MLSINITKINGLLRSYMIEFLLFSTLLALLILPPAPQKIELPEIIFAGYFVLLCLCIVFTMKHSNFRYDETHKPLFILLILYVLSFLFSAAIALYQSVPLTSVFRSSIPYVMFLPLAFIPTYTCRQKTRIVNILITLGLIQSVYIIGFFITKAYHTIYSLEDILQFRITKADPRCTVPFLLASATLPLHRLFNETRIKTMMVAQVSMLLSLLAAIVTLTRGLVLAILLSWVLYSLFYSYSQGLGLFVRHKIHTKKILIALCLLASFVMILNTPPFNYALEGLVDRFKGHGRMGHLHNDYSNGRFQEEWLPAIQTWLSSSSSNHLLGIGAGKPFYTYSGHPQTFIHNQLIYLLVYGGIFTLITSLLLFSLLSWYLLTNAMRVKDLSNLSLLTLFASMSMYAQLFAVHKLLAYNAILFLLIAMTISNKQVLPSQKTLNQSFAH